MRRLPGLLCAAVALAGLLPPPAAAAGFPFAQLSGANGCVNLDGSDGCADGRGLDGVRATVLSPDGENLYAVGGTQDGTDNQGNVLVAGAVTAFDRDPANGHITQLPGTDGCISDDGT